jgi:FkbM family methyltransferase
MNSGAGEKSSPTSPPEPRHEQPDHVVDKELKKFSKIRTARAIRREFSNWYCLVLLLALDSFLHVRRQLTWRTRAGTTFVTPPDGSGYPVREVFLENRYGLELLGPTPRSIIDIGANVGVFALRAAELFPTAEIIAFEPSLPAYTQLAHNLRANPAITTVDARRCAVVGSDAHEVKFWVDSASSTTSTLVATAVRDPSAGHWEKVPAVSLSDVLASTGTVDLLKLDVEGAEYGILSGTPPSAFARVQSVVLEYHRVEGYSFTDIVEALTVAGFRLQHHWHFTDLPDIGMLWFDHRPLRASPANSSQGGA